MIPDAPNSYVYISATEGVRFTYTAWTQACKVARYEPDINKICTSEWRLGVLTLTKERNHFLGKEGIRCGKTQAMLC